MTTQNQSLSGLTRRSIVSSLAVALPAAAMASTSLSVPAIAAPAGEADPIFAAISAYNVAREAEMAALAEYCRREEMVKREIGTLSPSVLVFSPNGPDAIHGQQVLAYTHEQIDHFCPPNLKPRLNALAHRSFAELKRTHDDIMGDAERVRDETWDATNDAIDAVVETVPVTTAGALGLLGFQRDILESDWQRLTEDHFASIIDSLDGVLRTMQAQA
jgi:hypothetical protein